MPTWTRRKGIQLAYPYEPHRLKKWPRPLLVQPKLNGNRCRAIISKERVVLLTSEENEFFSVPHISEALWEMAVINNIDHLELDGELYCHSMAKQEIDSITGRTKNLHPDHKKIQLHIFDLVNEYVTQWHRLDTLYTIVQPLFSSEHINFIETHTVREDHEVSGLFETYISEGYEGIVLRHSNAQYERRRTTNMLKWKARSLDSYLIVGYTEEIDQYGNPKGRLGSLTCEKDGQQFNVGSGTLLTHIKRQELWETRESLLGQYALIKYPELTLRGVPSHPTITAITPTEVTE